MMMFIQPLTYTLPVCYQKEQTLEALKIKKLYNQMVFTSEKALSYLKFIGTVPEEEF